MCIQSQTVLTFPCRLCCLTILEIKGLENIKCYHFKLYEILCAEREFEKTSLMHNNLVINNLISFIAILELYKYSRL